MYAMMSSPNSLFDQLERLQRQLAGALGGHEGGSIRSVAAGAFPAVNVGRTETSVEVHAFAPGLDASRIDVVLDRGVLRISGERAKDSLDGDGDGDGRVQVYARERRSGAFSRAIALSDEIDPAKVDASYRDGILRISIGLRAGAMPQRIKVQ